MGERLITQQATAATLGQPLTVEVDENIILPPGHSAYQFPLLSGRRRHPLPFQASLLSHVFPARDPVEVRLSLSYRYGLENAYDLKLVPSTVVGAPFTELHASWSRRVRPASEPPSFPTPRVWEHSDLAEFATWLMDKSTDLVNKYASFFSDGPAAITRLHRFACVMADAWDSDPPANSNEDLLVFAEWMRRSLEVPMRRLWDEGRSLSGASAELQQQLEGDFKHCLLSLAGLQGNDLPVLDASGEDLTDGTRAVQDVASLLLSRLHQDAPLEFHIALSQWLRQAKRDRTILQFAMNCVAYALGDGGGNRADAVIQLLDIAQEALPNGPFHPLAQLDVLRAITRAFWRHPQLLNNATAIRPEFVRWFLDAVQEAYRDLQKRLALVTERQFIKSHSRRFIYFSEILLSIFRLRTDPRYGGMLRAGSPSLLQLVWLVRDLDRTFADLSHPVRSSLRFDLDKNKPKELHRMSDLAYALDCYLTGNPKSNLIRIASVEDEDDATR